MLAGLGPAVGRHVPGVAAVDGPAAERADIAGATDDLGLSDRLRRRPGVLRPAVGSPWPAAGAARGARHLSRGDGGLRDGVFHRDADRRALRPGGRRLRCERAGARHRARHVRRRPHRPRVGADGVDHGVGAAGGAVDRRRAADGVRLAVEFRCAVLLLRGGVVDDLGAAAGDRAPAGARAGVVRLDLPVLPPLPRRPGLCRPSRHRDLLPGRAVRLDLQRGLRAAGPLRALAARLRPGVRVRIVRLSGRHRDRRALCHELGQPADDGARHRRDGVRRLCDGRAAGARAASCRRHHRPDQPVHDGHGHEPGAGAGGRADAVSGPRRRGIVFAGLRHANHVGGGRRDSRPCARSRRAWPLAIAMAGAGGLSLLLWFRASAVRTGG